MTRTVTQLVNLISRIIVACAIALGVASSGQAFGQFAGRMDGNKAQSRPMTNRPNVQPVSQSIPPANSQPAPEANVLVQQSRLVALGEMTGIIAHQWKQPLNSMSWQVQMLQEEETNPEKQQALQHIMDHLKFMNTTISNFRRFFHPDRKISQFDPCEAIQSVLCLLQSELEKHQIALTFTLPHTPVTLLGRPNEFQQVILNFVTNAQDAIFAKRRAAVENNNLPASMEPEAIIITCDLGSTLTIQIQDSGSGISAEHVPHIFDLHYTTKKGGEEEGSGIGLYVAKIIIEERMGGSIDIASSPCGTMVSVELPPFNAAQSEPESLLGLPQHLYGR